MLTLPPSVQIYLAVEPVDLRRGHDGLSAIVRGQWGQSYSLVPLPDDEHDCGWKAYSAAQSDELKKVSAQLEAVTLELAELKRRVLGRKSEKRKKSKMPPPVRPDSDPRPLAKTAGIAPSNATWPASK